jgi:hypothetical protein
MECRCADTSLTELSGDDALEYAVDLERVAEEKGQWLLRCPTTASEWVEDFPLDQRIRRGSACAVSVASRCARPENWPGPAFGMSHERGRFSCHG